MTKEYNVGFVKEMTVEAENDIDAREQVMKKLMKQVGTHPSATVPSLLKATPVEEEETINKVSIEVEKSDGSTYCGFQVKKDSEGYGVEEKIDCDIADKVEDYMFRTENNLIRIQKKDRSNNDGITETENLESIPDEREEYDEHEVLWEDGLEEGHSGFSTQNYIQRGTCINCGEAFEKHLTAKVVVTEDGEDVLSYF